MCRLRNEDFLRKHGLSTSNVLDYFYTSPFYLRCGGPESINERRRRGQREAATTGIEFVVAGANADAREGLLATSIFVLQRVLRRAGESATPQDAFYVLAGTVYKAPSLVDIFDGALCQSARAASSILKKQLESMRQSTEEEAPHAPESRLGDGWPAWCNFERPAVPAVWLRGAFVDSTRRVGVPGGEARETGLSHPP
ncbi:MED6 [Symbiodinium sp. CCMP2456]|nr:MED6 [Symbiodinium sp. CCMP2456]